MPPVTHRLHPLAAVQIFQKRWLLLLTPFLRALFLWQLDALWHALQQDAVLLCALLAYTYAAWRNTVWWYNAAPHPTLHLQRGLLLRQHLCIAPSQIALLCLARSLPLQCVGARRLLCYYKVPPSSARQPKPLALMLPATDANALLAHLLPKATAPTAPLPRQSLRRRSVFAFVWQAGLGLSAALLGCYFSWRQSNALTLSLGVASLFYALQLGMGMVGFCTEGIWPQDGYTTLRTQAGTTLWQFYLPCALPAIYYTQSPFAQRAGRASVTIYPVKGKSLRIRSVLLKSFTPFIGKD